MAGVLVTTRVAASSPDDVAAMRSGPGARAACTMAEASQPAKQPARRALVVLVAARITQIFIGGRGQPILSADATRDGV